VVKEVGKSANDVTVHTSKGKPVFPKGNQLIILVDKGSASASEILAGALSEHGIGTLVGTTTFGKGSVQEVVNLTSDTALKVTVAKWYTPNGVSISDSGLTPKIKIEQTEKAGSTVDEQLENAIKQFTK
jgi:carboxyl-terminal processing protease